MIGELVKITRFEILTHSAHVSRAVLRIFWSISKI